MKYCALLIILCSWLALNLSVKYDCCLSKYSDLEEDCTSSGSDINGTVYYCVELYSSSCSYCQINTDDIVSSDCDRCCVTDENYCDYSDDSTATTTSWALILLVFAGSCLCCSFIFLTAEENRLREGLTLQEAYLLPIPFVSVTTNFDNKDVHIPPDQPTAIGRLTDTIDVTVAEPTEFSPLMSRPANN